MDLTWHPFRVFMPDCAFQAHVPRDQRQYLGNWMAESTADVYTREKRNVVCAIWEKVTSNLDKINMAGARTSSIDLSREDQQDPQDGPAAGGLPVAGALGPEGESPPRKVRDSSPPSRNADSPSSSWLVTQIPADEVPPPQGPLTPVSTTLIRGSKK